MRPRSPWALVVAVLALVAMAGGVALALRSEDPYRPGTTHAVTLVNDQPECAYWMVRLGNDHAWRNVEDVPAGWVSPTEGRLEVVGEYEAVFEAVGGGTVSMGGGNTRDIGFTADCPATLGR